MFHKRIRVWLVPFFLFVGSLILYIHNLSPSVYGGDVGDLVTAAYLGGVPHPPGYPLFTFVGYLLSHMMVFTTPAFAVGLISAISGALSVLFFFLTLKRLKIHPFVATIATLTLASNYLFWFYNEIAEVFALNTFFIILLFYLAILFSQTKKRIHFFLFLFFLGLSFTHHQTIVLFVPSLFLLILPTLITQRKIWKSYFVGIAFFLLGLIPYIYVPLASSLHPALNWDNVHDIPSFLHLLLRKDYGTFQANGTASITLPQRFIVVKSYLQILLFETTIPVCVVSLIGFVAGIRLKRLLSLSLLLAFFLSGPFFIFYAGFPLTQNFFFGVNERFFTMSALIIFYFFAYGLEALGRLLAAFLKRPAYMLMVPAVFLLIPLQLFFYNFPKTDVSQVWIGDSLGRDILAPLPRNATLFLSGDTPLFNAEYMHYAMHVRSDIDIVNFAIIKINPYMQTIEKKVIAKNPTLAHQPPLLTIAEIQEVAKSRPVFSGTQAQGQKEKLIWVPYNLYYQYLPSKDTIPTKEAYMQKADAIWHMLHIPNVPAKILGSLTISEIPTIYSSAALVTGAYLDSQYHAQDEAKAYYEKAIAINPSNAKAYDVLGVYYLVDANECVPAKNAFLNAIENNPADEIAYILLYATYRECFHDSSTARTLGVKFQHLFGQDIVFATRMSLSGKGGLLQ